MKRSLITTLVIGVVVTIVAGALHATKAIAGFETAVAQLVSDYARATRVVGEKWQYAFVLVTAVGVAWLSLRNLPRLSQATPDRKSTRLNSSHTVISYAVFCLKKKAKARAHAH